MDKKDKQNTQNTNTTNTPNITKTPNLLYFAEYEHSILRTPTETVQFPLSAEDKQIIADMKYSIQKEQLRKASANWDAAVGMAANQWGINKRIFLYCPEGDTVHGLEVIINPSYEPMNQANATMEATWEACFSVPLATGFVQRYAKIKTKHQNERGEVIHRELEGWPARVWQHENDHLDGYLYDDPRIEKCLDKRSFNNLLEVEEFYQTLRGVE